jgi:hypothetical protein
MVHADCRLLATIEFEMTWLWKALSGGSTGGQWHAQNEQHCPVARRPRRAPRRLVLGTWPYQPRRLNGYIEFRSVFFSRKIDIVASRAWRTETDSCADDGSRVIHAGRLATQRR